MKKAVLLFVTLILSSVGARAETKTVRVFCGGQAVFDFVIAHRKEFEDVIGEKIEASVQPADVMSAALIHGVIDGYFGSAPGESIPLAKKRGVESVDSSEFDWVPSLSFRLYLAINPTIKADKLSAEQITGIFS